MIITPVLQEKLPYGKCKQQTIKLYEYFLKTDIAINFQIPGLFPDFSIPF